MLTKLDEFRRTAVRVYATAADVKSCIVSGDYMSLRDACQRYNFAYSDLQLLARQLTENDKIEAMVPDYDLQTITIRWRSGVETTYNYL